MTPTTSIGRLGARLAAAAAAATLLVPAAASAGSGQATHDSWYRYGLSLTKTSAGSPIGYRFVTDTLAPGGASARTPSDRFVTDTLAPGGATSSQAPSYRFVTDTLAPGGSVETVTIGHGFDWGDAGVGAGTAVAGLLAVMAGAVALMRRRNRLVL